MKPKPYYTTGEVADLLGISRATVSRKFEQGLLTGKKNPITGDRRISHESLRSFMREFNLSTISFTADVRTLLVISPDTHLVDVIQTILDEDDRYEVISVPCGAEALVICAREPVNYIVIDHDLPDLPGAAVIETLKKMDVLDGVKIIHCADRDGCHGIRSSRTVTAVEKNSTFEESLTASIVEFLDLEPVPARTQVYQHERRHPRRTVNLPARIWLYDAHDPENAEEGAAIIHNISGGGAYLTDINFANGFPLFENFRLKIAVDREPLENWEARLKVLRLQADGSISAGVQFIDISEEDRRKIDALTL